MAPPGASFFTAGQKLAHKDSYIIVNHCYVQYIPPASSTTSDQAPILFIHGGGLTGAMWESSPDLRPGWATAASRGGRHVYILDGVDHGRSASAPDAERHGQVEHRTAKEVWERFRIGTHDRFGQRQLFEGSQFPVEAFDSLLRVQAPRRRTTDEVERAGIEDAIKALGKCDIIAHSHGAALLLEALVSDEVKPLLHRVVLVEPGGTADAKLLTNEVKALIVWGDYLQSHAVWKLIVEPFSRALAENLHLPERGIKGNTHFPMSDKNSDAVWEKIIEWLNA